MKTRIITLIIFISLSSFIVIRDDQNDAAYLALAKKYPEVCKVGARGGDGTLISSQFVITAAHVAEGMWQRHGKNLKVFFEGQPEGIAVEQVFLHPDFEPMGEHDVALIKLSSPVGLRPAELYNQVDEKGKEIVIVGHGDFKTGMEITWKTDGKRRAATNRIDEVTPSQIIYRFDAPGSPEVTDLEGTAGRGDSGGPAFILKGERKFVAGISSAGLSGKNGPGTYGAIEHYTRVSAHLAWIEEVLSGKITQGMIRGSATQDRPTALDGLGLFLSQGDNRIDIEGKIDPEVPAEFRQLMFGPPPSFIVSLNGIKYQSLEFFKKDFEAIKKGVKYEIEFSVRGELKKFLTER